MRSRLTGLVCLAVVLPTNAAHADDLASLRADLDREAENRAGGIASDCGCPIPITVAWAGFRDVASAAKVSDGISHAGSGVGKVCSDDSARRESVCKALRGIRIEHAPSWTAPTLRARTLVVFSGAEVFNDYEAVSAAALAASLGRDPALFARPPRSPTSPGPDAELRGELDDDAWDLEGQLLRCCECPIKVRIDWSFPMTQELRTPLNDVLAQAYNGVSTACPQPTLGSPARALEEAKAARAAVCSRLHDIVVRRTDARAPPAFDGTTMTVSFDTQRVYDPLDVSRPLEAMIRAPFSGKVGEGGAPRKGALAGTDGPNGQIDDISGTIVWWEAPDGSRASIWVDGAKVAEESTSDRGVRVVRGKVPDGVAKLANPRVGIVGTATFAKGVRQGPTVVLTNGEVDSILDFRRGALQKERRFHVGVSSDMMKDVDGHKRGPLRWEGSYVDGQLDGVVKSFWQNGSRSTEETWRRGKKIGELRHFDPRGKPISAAEWNRLQNARSPAHDDDKGSARPEKSSVKSGKGGLCSSDDECMRGYRCVHASSDASKTTGHCR